MESYRIGTRVMIKLPWSEVCMHMRVADKVMLADILPDGVQLLTDDGRRFGGAITHGEAGVIAMPPADDVADYHVGHVAPLTGAWFCDTCNSPYCDLA